MNICGVCRLQSIYTVLLAIAIDMNEEIIVKYLVKWNTFLTQHQNNKYTKKYTPTYHATHRTGEIAHYIVESTAHKHTVGKKKCKKECVMTARFFILIQKYKRYDSAILQSVYNTE